MIGSPPSLAAFFEAWHHNSGEFLRYEGDLGIGHITYADAARCALGFAEHLRAQGIAKGDRLVFWGENRPEWVVALWACLLEGVVAVPVDFRSSAAIVERIAGIVEARALLLGTGLDAPASLPCPVWPMRIVLDVHAPRIRQGRRRRLTTSPKFCSLPEQRATPKASPSRIAIFWRT